MSLAERVTVARRFQRSVRIDTDITDESGLDGFICPKSSAEVLLNVAHHFTETGQAAFTWTGPYGSGKSSLIVAFSALMGRSAELRHQAAKLIGQDTAQAIWTALPPKSGGWNILPVVGRREDPVQVIGEALSKAPFWHEPTRSRWSGSELLNAIRIVAGQTGDAYGGLIIFLDEMGKLLEAAALQDGDIYFLQQLAEVASRSQGRLLVIGTLHQAFEEYAQRLSRDIRDEWTKIQGRFVDLAINTAGEEQLDLLARAIITDHSAVVAGPLAKQVAQIIRQGRPGVSSLLETTLEDCWPLNPIVAALLGPISRRRFGQNQRSIFAFLNSAEHQGFQDFIRHADDDALYNPDRLWDYLSLNLEPAILASPDGHRWSLAIEAIERCEGLGGDALHIQLLKTIALVDLFKERSGLIPSQELLAAAVPHATQSQIAESLEQLQRWSLVVYRKFANSYAIYAGSDFDIDQAIQAALLTIQDIDFAKLRQLAGIQPILAKRHYHQTGTLRWFDVTLVPLEHLEAEVQQFKPKKATMGQFVLTIPTQNEDEKAALQRCRQVVEQTDYKDIVVGYSVRAWSVLNAAKELLALEHVGNHSPELHGDAVARREVQARIAALQGQLEDELHQAFEHAIWHARLRSPAVLSQMKLQSLASDLADERYPSTPRIFNELLNRMKPSSNANAAQNALLKAMVLKEGLPRLGIEGFPAEGGLLVSILEINRLYVETPNGWRFVSPDPNNDLARLAPLWEAATGYLKANQHRSVQISELYHLWRQPPFGVADGLMAILAVAFVLSRREEIAFYRQGVFLSRLTDLEIDYLAKDANDIQVRWMNLSEVSRRLLSELAGVVRQLDCSIDLRDLQPIDVARSLIALYDQLPAWTRRTMRLSNNAVRIRNLFKQASDPNKFLFDDIPALFEATPNLNDYDQLQATVKQVQDGLEELKAAYPSMLGRLRELILTELQVPNLSSQSLAELRERAKNVLQLAGDFRLDAFISRLTTFDGSERAIESLASLAVNKPPRDWVDPDVDKAMIELSDMAQRFNRAESFARVKGRADKRHAMAVVVGINGRPTPVTGEFDITDSEREGVDTLIAKMENTLNSANGLKRNVILAALAELSARYLQTNLSHGQDEAIEKVAKPEARVK